MRFGYQSYPVKGVGGSHVVVVFRPMVQVLIAGPAGEVVVFGLVDTGADETLVPDRFMPSLGVVATPGEHATIRAVGGGSVPVTFGTVNFTLSTRRARHQWAARVAFHPGPTVILGHTGFLDHFTATFNGRRRDLTLRPNEGRE